MCGPALSISSSCYLDLLFSVYLNLLVMFLIVVSSTILILLISFGVYNLRPDIIESSKILYKDII